MQPVRIEGFTHAWHAPADWDEATQGPCATLYARQEVVDGQVAFTSAWQPTQEELLAILGGGTIYFRVMSPVHPVISLWAQDPPPDDDNPYGAPPPPAAA